MVGSRFSKYIGSIGRPRFWRSFTNHYGQWKSEYNNELSDLGKSISILRALNIIYNCTFS